MSKGGTITFLKCTPDDPDREARIERTANDKWWIKNLNMPYMGTRSEIITDTTLSQMLRNKDVKIKWD
jgi:hypothetical protein